MQFFRSERTAALVLAAAAVLGLVLANTPWGEAIIGVRDAHPSTGVTVFDLSIGHWIADGLLAVFFLIAAIELRHELTHGELDSPRKALAPAVAATAGVVVPAIVFLLVVRDPAEAAGWPIPTATDIAFALGVLALLGKGLPRRVRAFLLALAVLDDLIAIGIIAVFFTRDLEPLPLLLAVPVIAAFGWLSARRSPAQPWRGILLVVLGLASWVLVLQSGVHATIAGVALGLVYAPKPAARVRHALEPAVNGLILPLFALSASMVRIPEVREGGLEPLFWGIAIALPVGKLVGITGGAYLARTMMPKGERRAALGLAEVLVVATLGGVGFTISLLMGSLVAIVLGGATTAIVARRSRGLSSSAR